MCCYGGEDESADGDIDEKGLCLIYAGRYREDHIMIQLLLSFDFAGLTCSATRAASVKASLTPL